MQEIILEIKPSFDKVVVEFPAKSDSYVPLKKIGDYNQVGINKVDPNPMKLYMPAWYCWKYENSHGNPMEIILLHFHYRGDKSRYKVQFHSETESLSLREVEEITDIIFNQYVDKTSAILHPEPYPTVVEIALDHFECDSYYHYYSNQAHLFKKNCRKRIEYSEDNGEITMKGRGERRYRLLPEFATYYLGGKSSSIFARCYLMFPFDGGDPVYRLEPVFQRKYFENNGIERLNDLHFFNFADAWKNNFKFIKLNWDNILKNTENLDLSNPVQGLHSLDMNSSYSSAGTQYPTEIDIYDMVMMIPKNDIDWKVVYDSLPSEPMRTAFHEYWTTPKEFVDPAKLPRMRTPQEVFKELNLEHYTGISYEDVKRRLFYDPSKQILMEAPEFDNYNEMIVSALENIGKKEPVQYRIQRAMDKVRGTNGENNITKIAEIAKTTRTTVYKYRKSV